ncbi:MAG: glycosyltransferase family 4 protein, partial [Bacteroidales bacterium]|nr:glycosyltransferase family 4 protein [Bacteroidales bacterium]
LKRNFEDLRVNIYSLHLSRIMGLISGKRKLKKLVREIQPDIIHTQGIRPDLMVSGIHNIPKIATIRNYPFDDNPAKFGKFKGGIMAKTHFKTIEKGDHVIACSKSLANKFSDQHNIHLPTIQNGVNTNKFFLLGKNKKDMLRKKLGLPANSFVCLTSGGLIQRKNTDNLITGFVKAELADSLLLIAGDGHEMAKLNELANKNSSIRFLNSIPNVNEYLQASDLFISASFAEGLPNSVLEAMACGLPVVLSDIDPHKELISEGLSYNVFFNPTDTNQLAELINQFPLADLSKVSNQILEHCLANFSAESMSKKYQKLYKEVLHVR